MAVSIIGYKLMDDHDYQGTCPNRYCGAIVKCKQADFRVFGEIPCPACNGYMIAMVKQVSNSHG